MENIENFEVPVEEDVLRELTDARHKLEDTSIAAKNAVRWGNEDDARVIILVKLRTARLVESLEKIRDLVHSKPSDMPSEVREQIAKLQTDIDEIKHLRMHGGNTAEVDEELYAIQASIREEG